MASKRLSVADLAKEAGIDLDEALISLWDAGFERLNDPTDRLGRGDANRARRALGLATRRELASAEFWMETLSLSRDQLEKLLDDLGIASPFEGQRLRAKAIHRLRAERKRRTGTLRLAVDRETIPAEGRGTLEWEVIGHTQKIEYLRVSEVSAIHEALVTDFASSQDPIEPPGVRSTALLDSAVHRPYTGIGDILKYPTVEMAASALLHGLVHDHPFHNGNKRTALVAMLVFLDDNGLILTCDESALFKIVLQLAQHAVTQGPQNELADREVLEVARWIKVNSRVIEKGDRALSWRRLKQILASYQCSLSRPNVGNRINIERTVTEYGWFGRAKPRVLRTQTHYGDDGREVDKTAINRLRRELWLDDEHGIDSAAFYDDAAAATSDFIVRYRKTLRRLARL